MILYIYRDLKFVTNKVKNRSNDNPFLVCNRPFQLSTFPATASRVCERDPGAQEGGSTRRKVRTRNDLEVGSKANIC